MARPFRILSCDGGGMRGLLTAHLLEALEAKLQRRDPAATLTDSFDLFAGTSTGSIIACGLANGMSARSIREFYQTQGLRIFAPMDASFWLDGVMDRVARGHFSQPLFHPDGLEEVLRSQGIFPDTLRMQDLRKPALVVSYDTYNRKAVVFKKDDPKSSQVPVWQVCRASSAAPIAFPAYLMQDPTFLAHQKNGGGAEGDLPREIPAEGIPLIDGGILANNPSLCALVEASNSHRKQLSEIFIASFGTGQSIKRITPDKATSWGALAWADLRKGIPLYQVCADGSADVIDFIADSLVGDHYFRCQPMISEKISTFEAGKDNIKLLNDAADFYLKTGGDARLEALVTAMV